MLETTRTCMFYTGRIVGVRYIDVFAILPLILTVKTPIKCGAESRLADVRITPPYGATQGQVIIFYSVLNSLCMLRAIDVSFC